MKRKQRDKLILIAILLFCGLTEMILISCDKDENSISDESTLETPLTIEAIEAGKIKFRNCAPGPVICRLNGGSTKTICNYEYDSLFVNKGDIVEFFGDNETYCRYYEKEGYRVPSMFELSSDCYIYGNVMSLISSSNYCNLKELKEHFTFGRLFASCYDHLKSHPKKRIILPATTLADNCYQDMFRNCNKLTDAPELPATTLADNCYYGMFENCKSLTKCPELPATKLAKYCYHSMFTGCTSLTTTPELHAMTLAEGCYGGMFWDCTGLTKAPKLPATIMAEGCYYGTFGGCSNLTEAPELPALTLAESCYSMMFKDCINLTRAPALPAIMLYNYCYWDMFSGCIKLTEAPELPATTLVEDCYWGLFRGCTNLSSVTCLATNDISKGVREWLYGVSSTGTFTKAKGVEWPTGTSGIPSGWRTVEK